MITRIYILESIPSDEFQTGTDLYNDTISRYCQLYSPDLFHSHKTINSKQELIDSLKTIENEVLSIDEIVLHVEAHGAVDCMQLSNGELLSWEEFESYLVLINLKTRNKLHLNIVTCYGMHVAENIGKGLDKTAPYKSFTSVKNLLLPKDIIHDNTLLYEEIIKQREMYKAYVAFSKSNPNTNMKVKDVATVLKMFIDFQVKRFFDINPSYDIIMLFNGWWNLNMNYSQYNSLKTLEEKSKYVFESLGAKYFPN